MVVEGRFPLHEFLWQARAGRQDGQARPSKGGGVGRWAQGRNRHAPTPNRPPGRARSDGASTNPTGGWLPRSRRPGPLSFARMDDVWGDEEVEVGPGRALYDEGYR